MQSETGFLSLDGAWLHTSFLLASGDGPHYSAYHSPQDCDRHNGPNKGQIYSVWISSSRGRKSWITPRLHFSFSPTQLTLSNSKKPCKSRHIFYFLQQTIIPRKKITTLTSVHHSWWDLNMTTFLKWRRTGHEACRWLISRLSTSTGWAHYLITDRTDNGTWATIRSTVRQSWKTNFAFDWRAVCLKAVR